jgi:hypothetical protein
MTKNLCTIFYITLLSTGLRGSELPQDVRIILDQHSLELPELLKCRHAKKDWLPRYIMKCGIERVAHSEKLRQVIHNNKLYLLNVPRKYVYQICDKDKAPNNQNSIVVAEYIQGTPGINATLNLQQTQQLYCAAIHTPYYDMHCFNYIVTNQTVHIIDTDSRAMPPLYERVLLKIHWLLLGDGLRSDPSTRFKNSLHENKTFHTYNNDAEAWLKTTLEQRERWPKITRNCCLGMIASLSGIIIHQYITRKA